ncbi:alpha,alpha-trehalose-phosphate synthase (UDP-forming) [Salinigranum sp. GCM10025319]|uniref:alpha,alpha-trehalose-phosphate synthase (UDP-forming) n=1 Tax=Salinigranum sp. GCM10025319 TaxID=3252687 RepID=UPI00360ED276
MAETTSDRGSTTIRGRGRADETAEQFADDTEVVIVSNRQPYRHEWTDDGVTVDRPTGGLSEGLDSVARTIEGTWVAWGDGDADAHVVDEDDCVSVPPDASDDEQYDLRRVWLTDEQVEGYYYGFSNRVLWPVCHGMLSRIRGREGDWEAYNGVNERFADAVAARVSPGDVVWLQDYHFGRAPRLVRARVPDDVSVAQFWHVPWPAWDTFRACPHGEEILRGLLGNDLFGVHVPRYRENFLGCVDAALSEARIDWGRGRVFHRDGVTTVEAFPLGVDTSTIGRLAADDGAERRYAEFAADHGIDGDATVAVGVDRLDYTKGIPSRLDALERLLRERPEWRGDLTLVQVGTESRSRIPAYQQLQERVTERVERLNDEFGTPDWRPVVYTTERVSNATLYSLYRHADVGVVSPIRDGMNLVAQEFVAAQVDDPGVLVLSDQAGAHDLLGESAVTVTPQDTSGFASDLQRALTMSADERRRRLRSLGRETRAHDTAHWIDDVLDSVKRLRAEDADHV